MAKPRKGRSPRRKPKPSPIPKARPKVATSVPSIQQSPPDDKTVLDQILQRLEKERGNPAIVYWLTQRAKVSVAAEVPLYDHLRAIGHQKKLDVVIFTHGGDTEAPWRLVSLIREFCDRFALIVPFRSASAGTLMALGADEIVMTPFSVLGPIDPSRTHPLLPRRKGAAAPEPISVQDMRHAMQFIREASTTDGSPIPYTPEAMAHIFTALFNKIHPLAIGAIEQSYALAKLIGHRCLETHLDSEKDADEIKSIVDRLCDDYKSHSYPISRAEAKSLGLNVSDAPSQLETILVDLTKFYTGRLIGPFGTNIRPGANIQTVLAWMDSRTKKFRVMQDGLVKDAGEIETRGDQWVPY